MSRSGSKYCSVENRLNYPTTLIGKNLSYKSQEFFVKQPHNEIYSFFDILYSQVEKINKSNVAECSIIQNIG
jgi:hypothetical protein